MHSIQVIIADIRKGSNLCVAVESSGTVCFKAKFRNRKYCAGHCSRLTRFGCFDLPSKEVKRCKFIDCSRSYYSKGYCRGHYMTCIAQARNKCKKCSVDDCVNKRSSAGKFCCMHQTRLARYGKLEGNGKGRGWRTRFAPGHSGREKPYKECIATKCDTNSNDSRIVKGLCTKHYQRWKRYKDYNIVSIRGNNHGSHSKQVGRKRAQEKSTRDSACLCL